VGPEIAYAMAKSGVNFASAPAAEKYCQQIIDKLLAVWPGPKPVVRAVITDAANYGAQPM